MKNYLLPIYHSKLKPWIKWWLLKQLELRSKTLSDWIEGTTPITITGAFKGKIQNLELEGNTSQTGTPTPDNPIPVQVVKGHNVVKINTTEYALDLASKNLFNDILRNGVTNYQNGVYSSSTNRLTSTEWTILPAGTYTFNAVSTSEKTLYVSNITFDTSGNFLNIPDFSGQWLELPFTFTINQDIKWKINVRDSNYSSILPDEVINIMLNEGETALPYEEYYNYELCKIGDDYSDYILPDTNGYKIIKNIGKVVLNGSESWSLQGSGTANWYYYTNVSSINIKTDSTSSNSLCDHYAWGSVGVSNTNNGYYIVKNNGQVRIRYGTEDTVANYKTWLSNNNVSIYYVLSASTTETITNANLISQLNAIYNAEFKNGTNTITQTNSDLPFILHFKYYKKG